MGWWKQDRLVLGDEPLDLLGDCLEHFVKCYEEDQGRPPTLNELGESLRHVLSTYGRNAIPDLGDRKVTSVALKTRKLGKTQKYGVGDCFGISVQSGFYYGRILMQGTSGELVEIFDLYSKRLWSLDEFAQKPRKPLSWKWVNGDLAFRNSRWQIIGKIDVPADYEYPRFYTGVPTSIRISQGGQEYRGEDGDLVSVEREIMFHPQSVEDRLQSGLSGLCDPWPGVEEARKRDMEELAWAKCRQLRRKEKT